MTGRQRLIKDVPGLKAADKTTESGAYDELKELLGGPQSSHFLLKGILQCSCD